MKFSYGRLRATSSQARDYYARKAEGAVWRELGGTHLQLDGVPALPEHFSRLDKHQNPLTGGKLTLRTKSRNAASGGSHGGRRLGHDLVISADKPISVLALLGDDKRLVAAYWKVCCQNLGAMAQFAAARVRQGGANESRLTGHLVALPIFEIHSRHLNPQLHCHNFVPNVTYDPIEQRLKALEPCHLLRAQRLIEARLQADMLCELRRLNYVFTPRERGCVIAGLPERIRRLLCDPHGSARSQASISPARRKLERLKARPPYQSVDADDLKRRWIATIGPQLLADLHGLVAAANVHPPLAENPSGEKRAVQAALEKALDELTSTLGLFGLDQLEEAVLSRSEGFFGTKAATELLRQVVDAETVRAAGPGLYCVGDAPKRFIHLAGLVGRSHALQRQPSSSSTAGRGRSMAKWKVAAGDTPVQQGEPIVIRQAHKLNVGELEKAVEDSRVSGKHLEFTLPSRLLKGQRPSCALANLMRIVWKGECFSSKSALPKAIGRVVTKVEHETPLPQSSNVSGNPADSKTAAPRQAETISGNDPAARPVERRPCSQNDPSPKRGREPKPGPRPGDNGADHMPLS